ncbi:MAG TPA: hypothetical protein VIK72_13285 [Clostridiaceae bacterium]
MICSSCENEFNNVNGLKFCPYCGEKIIEGPTTEESKHDTLEMPIITEEMIKKYNIDKLFGDFKNILKQKKVILSIVSILFIMMVGVLGYKFLIAKPVNQSMINEDLIGKIVTLPSGTKMEVKKSYIKSLSIKSSNTDKKKSEDTFKVAITLNNGEFEAKTLLSMMYIDKGKNQWEFSGTVGIVGDVVIKPVVGIDDKLLLEGLKKQTIVISDETIDLSENNVKSFNINLRTPDLEKSKEEVLVTAKIDNGLLTAAGDIKCELEFINEKWAIDTIERNSTEDFKLAISPSFPQEKIIEIIKKQGLQENVTYKDLFGGKSFAINDSFTKSTDISNTEFDVQNKILKATSKRENIAGQLTSTLETNYTFSLSFSNIAFLAKSQSTVLVATVNEISNDYIIGTIPSTEIEGSNVFLLFPTTHKITTEEAKTFKTSEILSQKNINNIKYVYGNITYMDKGKLKTVNVVAIYSLVYDSSNGYSWKLDKIVSEDSPNYKTYSKVNITK